MRNVMERLTELHIKKEDGYYMVCSGSECTGLHCEDCPELDRIIDTLGAHEDTGFSPEEIKSAFTQDALIKLAAQALGTTPERLRELAAADKEGRVVILPCKRGGKIYAPRKRGIDTYEVIAIAEDEKGVQLLGKCKCSEENWVTDVFNACDFGKNVFLTREEAERAMEGRKNG